MSLPEGDGADRLAERTQVQLGPDPSRVVSQLFVAGEEFASGASRTSAVARRVLDLDDDAVDAELARVLRHFQGRHAHLAADLVAHFNQINQSSDDTSDFSVARRMLLGAYATSEYAVESAALCNPSIVAHPTQADVAAGALRVVLSLRAVGEGHVSSIEFRTGVLDEDGDIHVEDPGRMAVAGRVEPGPYDRDAFASLLAVAGDDPEVASAVLGRLPATFTRAELAVSMAELSARALQRSSVRDLVDRIRTVADANYTASFPEDTSLAQRVLRPGGPTESHGMEDARFVRFVDDDASVTYFATYTAFDGSQVSPRLLATDDFRTFITSQLTGRAATNKGMALFPRRINGRYVALSRWDRESNAITTSADAHAWDEGTEIQHPRLPWELVQVGNCGSPMETAEGWLVITHGVGPMRTYSLGAMLLERDDPRVMRGQLTEPLLEPISSERDGYVPNVVYSCGSIVHGDWLVLPYAYGDRTTTFARVPLAKLLRSILSA